MPPTSTPNSDEAAATVSFELVASGDVSDYSPTVIDGIKASVADTIEQVDPDDVTVEVSASSAPHALSTSPSPFTHPSPTPDD